jgi:para-aminobenzoate synthetase / 4-amino-4-deoxychorismate lyase
MESTAREPIQAVFQSHHPWMPGWSCFLSRPEAVLSANTVSGVLPLLHRAWEASLSGMWVALCLSYEASPAMDPALRTHPPGEFPLAWAAIFDRPGHLPEPGGGTAYTLTPWKPLVSREEYDRSILEIKDRIDRGETYQVNYTVPFRAGFTGSDRAWYDDLALTQGAPYSAYLNMGRFRVLSLSPELFLRIQGNILETMPMKGTMRRGRWKEEDELLAAELARCAKNRAENVMIVDLMRSDLGKVALAGTVQVEGMFQVQRFRSVLQMVSTVRARARQGSTLVDLFRALFPGGSVTGAPKIRTMEILRALEPHPRGIYTGALGFLSPGGEGVLNLPIRTVLVDALKGEAEFHVGGGITAGSTPGGEFEECMVKMSFLTSACPGFSLLETLLLREGRYFLLARHLERMQGSADHFLIPYREEVIMESLDKSRLAFPRGSHRVRLLLSQDGTPRTECFPLQEPRATRLRIGLAREPVSSGDVFLYHKTTNRSAYDTRLGGRPGCDDVLLFNERGELTETTRANLVLDVAGKMLTPPRSSGLLAGTYRQELLERGVLRERILHPEDLGRARRILLINSVRGWMEAEMA